MQEAWQSEDEIATELSHSINLFPANYSIVSEGAAKEKLVDSELELVLLIYLWHSTQIPPTNIERLQIYQTNSNR